jgi:hypothetical protein
VTLRTGPSLTTLALLGGAVLALHLGLLSAPSLPDAGTPAQARLDPSAPPVRAAPPAVQVTQVRQVALTQTTAATTTATRAATAARATKPTQAAPAAPRPATAAPAVAAIEPAPEPAIEVAPAPGLETPLATAALEPEPEAQPATPQQVVQTTPSASAGSDEPTSAPSTAEPALPPSDLPPSVSLPYEVTGEARGYAYRASGQLDWRLEGQRYEARMELSMLFLGSRVQTSRGGVGPEGLRPERFADRRSSERAAHFDREGGRIRFSNNAPSAPLLPGAQDRLSLFLQLAGLLRARNFQEGESITFQVAGIGDAEPWRFDVGPLETLALPAGTLQARRLSRTPRKPHDSTVEVWLAPSLDHLPVRLRVAQANGDFADQRLARLP